MSMYQAELPNVFPFKMRAPQHFIRQCVIALTDLDRTDVPQGSSFAVTVDNWDGSWNLWLSSASCNFIQAYFEGYDDIVATSIGAL